MSCDVDELLELKGVTGSITASDESVEISRESYGGFISQGGFAGKRKLFFKDITAIEYKKPTFWSNGYIKMLVAGLRDTRAAVSPFGSSVFSARDPNTIILRAYTKQKSEETDRICKLIIERFERVKSDK